ncbi:MAG: PIN domain-containing protein [Thermomicrobiales bacterium]
MSATFGAVLDANVLIPMALCDTLMHAAIYGLYHPLWTDRILAEVERNLVANGLATAERAQRRIRKMIESQPHAMVTGYANLIRSMTNDAKDRHVLAAAVRADARIVVTFNGKDFPATSLAEYDIEAQSPDDFLLHLSTMKPNVIAKVIREQAATLKRLPNPDITPTH